MRAFDPAGTGKFLVPADEVVDEVKRLREVMYREGAGTWFSVRIAVEREGRVESHFGYDEEPEWDTSAPPAHEFVDDFECFPRSGDSTPDWLRRRLSGGPESPMATGSESAS